MIFGANTDVGKTVLSTALVKSSLTSNTSIDYIKPLGCGGSPTDVDFVERYGKMNINPEQQQLLQCHSLFQWDTPTSPHLASRNENVPQSDKSVLHALRMKLREIHNQTLTKQQKQHRILIELAGGVLSPSSASPLNNDSRHANGIGRRGRTRNGDTSTNNDNLSWGWSTQADLFQPINLPVLLVADGNLGGISTTLASIESLLIRGYNIHAIAMIDNTDNCGSNPMSSSIDRTSNASALHEYISNRMFQLRSGNGRAILGSSSSKRGPEELAIISLPPLPPEAEPLDEWYECNEVREKITKLDQLLIQSWKDDIETMDGLVESGVDTLWWPFTQHQPTNESKQKEAIIIDSASGDNFSILKPTNTATTNKPNKNMTSSFERTEHFDACASWWTQGLGHGESSLALAAAAAAGRYGHVIFPNVVNEPSVKLAEKLLGKTSGSNHGNCCEPGKGWASRVFFTDDGSTAMEVAIKMGMRKYCSDRGIEGVGGGNGEDSKNGMVLTVCAQKDCYHGDTLGVMDVAEPSVFNAGQHPWYEPKGLFLAYPTLSYQDGVLCLTQPDEDNEGKEGGKEGCFDCVEDALNMEERIKSDLYNIYVESIQNHWDSYERSGENSRVIASVVIEPLLLGAGGMRFVDPLWQRALIDVAKSKLIPVIFDEVAAGLFRLGVASCREILKVDPDIASYAKLLTGGLVPMSVTLASEDVFNSFLGDSKAEALLHGHSYTAHPVGCVSSLHALETFENLFGDRCNVVGNDGTTTSSPSITLPYYFNQSEVSKLSRLPKVQESMSLGTILAVTIEPDEGGESGYAAALTSQPIVKYLFDNGVYARPLGNVVYIMVSPLTSSEECSRLCQILYEAVESISK